MRKISHGLMTAFLVFVLTIACGSLHALAGGNQETLPKSIKEGFEGGAIPEGWTLETDSSGYNWTVGVGDYDYYQGSNSGKGNALITHVYNYGKAWLITPKLDLSGVENLPNLNFAFMNRRWGSSIDGFGVYWRVDGGAWQQIYYTEQAHESWTEQSLYLPDAIKKRNVEIGFMAFDMYGRGVALDDVSLDTVDQSAILIAGGIEYGEIFTNVEYAEAGEVITITTAPDGIRETKALTVMKGSELIEVTEVNETKYVFVMPDGEVTIRAEFVMPQGIAYYENFEVGAVPQGWSLEDWDGDGQTWYVLAGGKTHDKNGNTYYHSKSRALTSASFNNEALKPNNWAFTPAIAIPKNAKLSFWIKADDPDYPNENLAVYVGKNPVVKEMKKVGGDYTATAKYVRHEIDLSAYEGQSVYVGFRHYNVTNQFRLNLDDVAVIGEVPQDTDLTLTVKHNVEFDNNIAMHYVIPKSELEGYSYVKLVIDKETYAAGAESPTIKQYVLENPESYEMSGVDYWHFTFPGIAAAEMGNVLRAKVTCQKDGIVYESQTDAYSVKEYAYNRLAKTSNPTYQTLLVDMLNYGAMAQTHFDKNAAAANLVNADLTDKQKAYGTPIESFSAESCEKLIPLNGATATFEKKNLLFDSSVVLAYRLEFQNYTEAMLRKVKVVFSYNNGKMEKSMTVPFTNFEQVGSLYVVYCDCLTPAEMGCVVNATIYDGNQPISDTLQYSIETYVNNRLLASGSETYKKLMKHMILYGRSVKAHFK